MFGNHTLFNDEERLVVLRNVRVWMDTITRADIRDHIWALFEHHVAGVTDDPPAPPMQPWVDQVNARFERLVRKVTGITINVGRVLHVEGVG